MYVTNKTTDKISTSKEKKMPSIFPSCSYNNASSSGKGLFLLIVDCTQAYLCRRRHNKTTYHIKSRVETGRKLNEESTSISLYHLNALLCVSK